MYMQLFDTAITSADVNQWVVLSELITEAYPAFILILLHSVFFAKWTTDGCVDGRVILRFQVFTTRFYSIMQGFTDFKFNPTKFQDITNADVLALLYWSSIKWPND